MSKKLMMLCLLMTWGGMAAAQGQETADPAAEPIHNRRPLDHARQVKLENEAKNPQAPGATTANERVNENQARWILKHQTPGAERVEGVERVERVERAERPDRPERADISARVESARVENGRALGAAPRPERPGLGKGR